MYQIVTREIGDVRSRSIEGIELNLFQISLVFLCCYYLC